MLENSVRIVEAVQKSATGAIAPDRYLRPRCGRKRNFFPVLAAAALVVLTCGHASANHLRGRHSTVGEGPVYNKPIYNPETKSYFELFTPELESVLAHKNIYGITWRVAAKMAMLRKFKGVPGRLAVVKSRSVNDFLRKTFSPDQSVWIGLRYYCNFGVFQWITGEIMDPKKDFSVWTNNWNQSAVSRYQPGHEGEHPTCGISRTHHWGVHYWPIQDGWVWNANGHDKHFNFLFIEYPTGKP